VAFYVVLSKLATVHCLTLAVLQDLPLQQFSLALNLNAHGFNHDMPCVDAFDLSDHLFLRDGPSLWLRNYFEVFRIIEDLALRYGLAGKTWARVIGDVCSDSGGHQKRLKRNNELCRLCPRRRWYHQPLMLRLNSIELFEAPEGYSGVCLLKIFLSLHVPTKHAPWPRFFVRHKLCRLTNSLRSEC
jgi:hypothetical protein